MNILVIGDVHGCYFTFKKMVEEHWNPKKDFLVQVGDIFTKGNHPAKMTQYAMNLQREYPHQVYFLMGNHEQRYLKVYAKPGKDLGVQRIVSDFMKHNLNVKKINAWVKKLPVKWENQNVLVTHAGVSKMAITPFALGNSRGVLHNRSALKNIGKTQIYGHKMQSKGQIVYKEKSNSWCIDTGAWVGKSLSAIKLKYSGAVVETFQIKTLPEDL